MITQKLKAIIWLAAFVVAASPACSQIVRIEFTSQVFEVVGSPLVGVTVGSVITGHVEVDLASLPTDEDPWESVGLYPYSSAEGGRPGFVMEFDTGFERISYDSINAANDPGITPGIFMHDEAGAHDWLGLQARDQGEPYATGLSFEAYMEPRTLTSGDYFPESVNLQAGLEKARFYYTDYFGANAVAAIVTAASMTVEPGGSIALLALRVQASELSGQRKRVLLGLLEASEVAFAQGRCDAGLRQLQTFQNKVQAQVERTDALLAGRLIAGAQAIINSGCSD